jgi:dTDP-4-dehydrorhamnose 3,5-epimerase
MNVVETPINGLYLIESKIFEDDRGYFFESYNINNFKKNGINTNFVQDNESNSSKDVLRGLHFQSPPYAQAKLVKVATGSILDVAVDIRKNSKTYGKYYSVILTRKNKKMLYIPEGFAHGFLALEDDTTVQYKCSNLYNKECDTSIIWNDSTINIDWGIHSEPTVSGKDKLGIRLVDLNTPF